MFLKAMILHNDSGSELGTEGRGNVMLLDKTYPLV